MTNPYIKVALSQSALMVSKNDNSKLSYSVLQIEKVRIVLTTISFSVCDDLPDVLADVRAPGDKVKSFDAPATSLRPEQLEAARHPVLDHSVLAQDSVASAHLVAFKYHLGIVVGEFWTESPLAVVPEVKR